MAGEPTQNGEKVVSAVLAGTLSVDDALRLVDAAEKRQRRVRRKRTARKVAAFASLPFGLGLAVPDDWWKGNK